MAGHILGHIANTTYADLVQILQDLNIYICCSKFEIVNFLLSS